MRARCKAALLAALGFVGFEWFFVGFLMDFVVLFWFCWVVKKKKQQSSQTGGCWDLAGECCFGGFGEGLKVRKIPNIFWRGGCTL